MLWCVADFETSVYDCQEETEVWCAGIQISDSEVYIVNSLTKFMNLAFSLQDGMNIFFHNVKFDGSFIIPWLFNNGYTLAYDEKIKQFTKKAKMKKKTFTCHINRKGIWYSITVKTKYNTIIRFIDSYKLMPFSLRDVGEAFDTKHKKLYIEYYGERHEGHILKKNEEEYFRNDLAVMYEALPHVLNIGDRLTIGSNCLEYFKKIFGFKEYHKMFPNVYNEQFENKKGYCQFESIGKYILRSYNGAYVYIKEGCENKVFNNGITIDATSLYPSVMHSKSGFCYPCGHGEIGNGKAPSSNAIYYYQRIKCKFKIKEGYLPFIRIRGNPFYSPRKIQTESAYNSEGITVNESVELILGMYELELFFEHYQVFDLEYIDFVAFGKCIGIFDDYIDEWIEKKEGAESKVERSISKLYLNNLYGKFAAVPDSSFHVPFMENGILRFHFVEEEKAKPGYIPIGAAITSHARIVDIKAAQSNYDAFIYTDTDSLHLACTEDEVKGVKIAEHELCTFKVEARWDKAIFNNVKRYIEHTDKYEITCAGMVSTGKEVLALALEGRRDKEILKKYNIQRELNSDEKAFIDKGLSMQDFKSGLVVPNGKTKAKKIKGGTVIYNGDFTIL